MGIDGSFGRFGGEVTREELSFSFPFFGKGLVHCGVYVTNDNLGHEDVYGKYIYH